jgi:hypothetical protein
MSNAAVNWARPIELSPVRKAVLLNLAERANTKTGRCWPCMKTIARETGYCLRAIRFALRDLEEQGLIRTLRQIGRRSIYWVTFGLVVLPPEPQQLDLNLGPDLGAAPGNQVPGTAAPDSPPPRNQVPGIQPSEEQPSGEPRESADAPARASSPPVCRSPLPEDWQPSAADIAFALTCGLLDPRAIAAAFRDHYRALGSVRADWAATWRVWCRREPRINRPAGQDRGSASKRPWLLAALGISDTAA